MKIPHLNNNSHFLLQNRFCRKNQIWITNTKTCTISNQIYKFFLLCSYFFIFISLHVSAWMNNTQNFWRLKMQHHTSLSLISTRNTCQFFFQLTFHTDFQFLLQWKWGFLNPKSCQYLVRSILKPGPPLFVHIWASKRAVASFFFPTSSKHLHTALFHTFIDTLTYLSFLGQKL